MPIDPKLIISEVVRGKLQNEMPRLARAVKNFDFFEARFELYPTREENDLACRMDRRRTSRLMNRIVQVLTESLHKKPPTRALSTGAEATAWLARCYAASNMAAVWRKADQFAHVADVAAIQWFGVADPAVMVRARLWKASEFVTWMDGEDPMEPAAVGVLDFFDASARLRVWTAAELLTFTRPKDGPLQTAGGRAWSLAGRDANELGLVPFSFVHHETPTTDFWEPGIGDFLCQLNDNVNGQLDELGDSVRFGLVPILLASDVSPLYAFPRKVKPGQAITLPAAVASAAGESTPTPRLEFVAPPTEHITVGWADLDATIDRGLEDCGIPPSTVRAIDSAKSGVAILLETGPLVKMAEARRPTFDGFEQSAARTAARVAAAHCRAFNIAVPAWLDATAAEPAPVQIRWAPLYVQLPGAERDRSDQFALDAQLTDKVEVLMAREDLTEDEAFAKLERIADRNRKLAALGINPAGTPAPPAPRPAPPTGD